MVYFGEQLPFHVRHINIKLSLVELSKVCKSYRSRGLLRNYDFQSAINESEDEACQEFLILVPPSARQHILYLFRYWMLCYINILPSAAPKSKLIIGKVG
ncbi:hypothetical protein HHI36_001664 [Cryptolaemus montrouzieri]|uniref:Maturase K n=1 Tax=Cryptolaemus montrouzieri TaxID=559131 RepID=A0ABD2P914_9CUCU